MGQKLELLKQAVPGQIIQAIEKVRYITYEAPKCFVLPVCQQFHQVHHSRKVFGGEMRHVPGIYKYT